MSTTNLSKTSNDRIWPPLRPVLSQLISPWSKIVFPTQQCKSNGEKSLVTLITSREMLLVPYLFNTEAWNCVYHLWIWTKIRRSKQSNVRSTTETYIDFPFHFYVSPTRDLQEILLRLMKSWYKYLHKTPIDKTLFLPSNNVSYFGGKKHSFLLCWKIKYIKSRKKLRKVFLRDRCQISLLLSREFKQIN